MPCVSFALQVSATSYAGNGSTVTAYPVTFPVVSPAHIAVTVQSPAGADPELLEDSQFDVRDLGNGSYEVTTSAPWPPTDTVTVFRSVPFDQPFEFPEGGLLRTTEIERSFDRVVMQIQQLWRLVTDGAGGTVLPGAGSVIRSLAVWSDATAQAAVIPGYTGQIGVRLSDNSIWISQSTTAGDWASWPVATGHRVRLAFVADCGQVNAEQGVLASWLSYNLPDFDAVVFGGDNSYGVASGGSPAFDADWAAFAPVIAAGKAVHVYGNHEWDYAGIESLVAAKFPYLPGNRRDYSLKYGGGLVEIFVVNSARKTDFSLTEPNGQGSAQYARVAARLAASTARWKLVFLHHPMTTTVAGANRYDAGLAWDIFADADAIFAGHVHCSEAMRWSGVPVFNASGCVRLDGGPSYVPLGAAWSRLDWADGDRQLACVITATQKDCSVEFLDMLTLLPAYSASIQDATPRHAEWTREVWGPGEALELGGWRKAGSVGRAMEIDKGIRCDAEVGSFGTHTSVQILVNNNVIALAYFGELAKQAYIAPHEISYSGLRLREGDVISARVLDGPGAYESQAFGYALTILGRYLS